VLESENQSAVLAQLGMLKFARYLTPSAKDGVAFDLSVRVNYQYILDVMLVHK